MPKGKAEKGADSPFYFQLDGSGKAHKRSGTGAVPSTSKNENSCFMCARGCSGGQFWKFLCCFCFWRPSLLNLKIVIRIYG